MYTYRVIPVNAELLENGVLLEGVQSVQVAQVRRKTTGESIREWWTHLFTGEREAERPASLLTEP